MATNQVVDKEFAEKFINSSILASVPNTWGVYERCFDYEDSEALNHLQRTSCSLESLVVGEKEILPQMRKAYECCKEAGLTGDYLRMVMATVVKTAKEVYTNTNISKNPISVVSLAYRKLKDIKQCSNARVLIIGAGETTVTFPNIFKNINFLISRYLTAPFLKLRNWLPTCKVRRLTSKI